MGLPYYNDLNKCLAATQDCAAIFARVSPQVQAGQELFAYYMHVIIEITPRPPDSDLQGFIAETNSYDFFVREPYTYSLEDHMKRRFILETEEGDEARKVRVKLFQIKKPSTLDERALDLFYSQWMNEEAASCFTSFLYMDQHPWGRGQFLGKTANYKIQNSVTLLKHVAHSGLDLDWIAPAFFFVTKFRCMQTRDHELAAEQFFELLERGFVAHNIFCKREPKNERFPDLRRKSPSTTSYQSSFCKYMQHYRELIEVIYKADRARPSDVIKWMQERAEERCEDLQGDLEKMFHAYPSFDEEMERTRHRKRAAYVLLKAECAGTQDPQKLYALLSDRLPRSLQGNCNSERSNPSHEHVAYRKITLEHIHNQGNAAGWSEAEHKNYVDSLGNYALLTQQENTSLRDGSFGMKWDMYQNSEFSLTKALCEQVPKPENGKKPVWSQDDIEKRRKSLLKEPSCGLGPGMRSISGIMMAQQHQCHALKRQMMRS